MVNIAVIFFLIGATFNVMTLAKDQKGSPWNEVWAFISGLHTKVDSLNASLVELQSDVEKHSFIKSADFIIENDNGTIRAFSGTTGELKNSSSTLIATWTWTTNIGLASGRTWKQVVRLKGNFTVTDTMKIPSYTILDLSGAQLVANASLNKDMIQNSDEISGNTHIDIIGGVIDMNGAYQDATMDGIEFGRVTYGEIFGVTLLNGYRGDGDSAGLSIWSSNKYVEVAHNRIKDCKFGFRLENSHLNSIVANKIYDCHRGLYIKNSRQNTVTGNVLVGKNDGSNNYGITLTATVADGVQGNTLSANVIEGWQGGWPGGSSIGLVIGTDSNNNCIIGNSFKDNAQCVSNSGSGNIFKGNAGFVTENSGTVVIGNNGDFAHGLSGKPTSITLTSMNATYGGVPVIVSCDYANTDSTNVRISLCWTNETAITDNLLISYYVEYQP